MAQRASAEFGLVVPDRSLFRTRPTVDDRFCYDEPARFDAATKECPGSGSTGSGYSNDAFWLELYLDRSRSVVPPTAALYQRADGDLRRLAPRAPLSRPALVASSSCYARACHRGNDRVDEVAARAVEPVECACLPSCSGDRG